MAATLFTVLEQKIELNDVTDIVITTTELDADGTYVREIRITGSYAVGVSGNPRSLTLRVRGATKEDVNIETPELTF